MNRPSRVAVAVAGALTLAGGSGFLTARALSSTIAPARTVTINVATGARGPAGPPGPKGDQGPPGPPGLVCPSGFAAGELVINHPGGQVTLWTCLKN